MDTGRRVRAVETLVALGADVNAENSEGTSVCGLQLLVYEALSY